MPTISQLPAVAQVTPADRIPLSQSGATHSVSLGTLLSGTQPAIVTGTGTLLGRTSIGPGGPEAIAPGEGLLLNGATLSATGVDHAGFAVQGTLLPTDQAVVNSAGQPKLLQLSLLRGLFAAGSNISISSTGTIDAAVLGGSTTSIASLPSASPPSAQDLIGISQGGADHAISYAALLDGMTIDMAQLAGPAQDGDQFWVSQGGSTMARQSLGALWAWLVSKLPGCTQPVVELSADTTLDTTIHNQRILICSQPMSLNTTGLNLGNGFACDVINLSSGAVDLASSVLTSSGVARIAPGQMAAIRCATYSGGTIVYASLSNPGAVSVAPASVTGLALAGSTPSSISLSWNAVPGAASYLIEYRAQGDADWTLATSGLTATAYAVTGLQPGSAYEFGALAVNAAGSSPSLATITAPTADLPQLPGQVTGLSAGTVTASSIALSWSAPASGASPFSYTVQYKLSNTPTWSNAATGNTGTQFTVSALLPGAAYDFQIFASNTAGAGPASSILTVSTAQESNSVTAVTWNLVPANGYTQNTGAVAVNVHVTPGTAPVQFGLSVSGSTQPASWTPADHVNTDLWGAYLATPSTAGTYYVWVSGTDGSCPTVYPTPFTVN